MKLWPIGLTALALLVWLLKRDKTLDHLRESGL